MPNTPGRFHYINVERTFVTLEWDAVSGVDGYKVYLDGVEYGATTNTVYTVSGLVPNNYDFAVSSYIGNDESELSVLPKVRTGLYPDEALLTNTPYTLPTPPTDTTPYTNEFGLTERKLTQRSVRGDVTSVEKKYAKLPHWTRDESEMITQNPYDIYDANTFALKTDRVVSLYTGYDMANGSYRPFGNELGYRDVNGTLTNIRTFSEYDNISIAPTAETQPSWDGNRWAFEGRRDGKVYLFTYEISTDTKFGEVEIPDVGNGWTAASPYGNYAAVLGQIGGTGTTDYYRVYDFETLQEMPRPSHYSDDIGHGDMQVSIQGNECLVARWGGMLTMYMCETGEKIQLLEYYYALGHVSGKNMDQPGWAFSEDRSVKTYAETPEGIQKVAYRKVFATCLDENRTGIANVLNRVYGRVHLGNDDTNSFVATPNNTGEKVAWNNFSNNASYSNMEVYVAQRTTGENTTPPENIGAIEAKPTVGLITKKGFPDLWGEGANLITGGSGGVKFFITSTSDDSTATYYAANGTYEEHYRGTLRGALTRTFSRHIIPRVSGKVTASSKIQNSSSNGNFTYHGHLAPVGGLYSTGKTMELYGDNSVIRFMRHRHGNTAVVQADDAITILNSSHVALDRCSFGWGADESCTVTINESNQTYSALIGQNLLITESRNAHNTGSILGSDDYNSSRFSITWHNNVYTGPEHRTPNTGGTDGDYFRISNVITYDQNTRLTNIVGEPDVDMINNYHKKGPTKNRSISDNRHHKTQNTGASPGQFIYAAGSYVPSELIDPLADNKPLFSEFYVNGSGGFDKTPTAYFRTTPLSINTEWGYQPTSALDAYERLVTNRDVGANRTTASDGSVVIGHDTIDDWYLDALTNSTGARLSESSWIHPTPPTNTFMTDTNYNGIYDPFEVEHGINSSTDVILNWDFGEYQVINTAGYDAFEIFSAYQAGDFDRLEKINGTVEIIGDILKRKINSTFTGLH